jgi:AcrR family transcriptional regulator
MNSNKASAKSRRALAPQRRNGRARVEAVLAAAAAVIAERGYDTATMAEIAARAGSPIGSLYRFFPHKESLADALMQRYTRLVNEAFDALDRQARVASLEQIADAILDFKASLHAETRVMVALLEGTSGWSAKRRQFHEHTLRRIAQTLTLGAPALPPAEARDVAVILLHNMKAMKCLILGGDAPSSPGAATELRRMNRVYLRDRLAGFQDNA